MSEFAKVLKSWRKLRRYSQLDLATKADISGRHMSFLETGRARPSREMVLQLCEALQLPLDVSNQFLTHAGFAARYGHHEWTDAEMAPIYQAIERSLLNHMPYPGIAVNRLWKIEQANGTATSLFSQFGIGIGDSLLDFLMSGSLPNVIENWPEVAQTAASRLRVESIAQGGVPEFDKVSAYLSQFSCQSERVNSPVIPTIVSVGGTRLSMFTTIAQMGTPVDIALDDFKVELYFPLDHETATAFQNMSKFAASM